MATVPTLTDDELGPEAAAVFADIRATRNAEYVNDFWRALANDPATLRRTWDALKAVMGPGVLEPKDAKQRALASQWMDWQLSVAGPAITPAFWGLIRTPAEQRDMAAIKASQDKTTAAMQILDAQLAKLKASNADIFIQFTTPKFATMAIRRSTELGWRPTQFVASVSNSYSAVIQPAGPQNAEGLLSAAYRLEGEDSAAAGEVAFRG